MIDADRPAASEPDAALPPPAGGPTEPTDDVLPTADPPDDPDEDALDADEAAQLRRGHQVFNNFFGSVDATGSQFGVSARGATRHGTGRITVAAVEERLRCFVRPAPFAAARATLTQHQLVILTGAEGSGRHTGALALLAEVSMTGKPLTSLSPALTVSDLANYPRYLPGRGYLVRDRVGDDTVAAVRGFELDRLLHTLREHHAYLVVTATTVASQERSHPAGLVAEWAAPDPVELFSSELVRKGVRIADPAELATLRDGAAKLPTPRDVVAFAARAGDGPAMAFAALEDHERDRVTGWFEEKPTPEELLCVAALAFAHGLPVRTFEAHLARLTEIVRAHAPGPRDADADWLTRQRWADWAIRPTRTEWTAGPGLATVTTRIPPAPGEFGVEPRLVFRADRARAWVIAELHRRYGHDLWAPLREWIGELACRRDPELNVQLGLGVALLARPGLQEVRAEFLDPWSNGLAAERATAAYVLSWLCVDDALAPIALRIALGWTRAGARKSMTAAIAFGGELGLRYESEALRWLWHLSTRAESVRRVARAMLAGLFAAGAEESRDTANLLRFLRKQVQRADADNPAAVRIRLDTVLQVLSAERPGGAEPAAAQLLRCQPGSAANLGALWAELLRSGPHRGGAIDTLRSTVESIGEGAGSAEALSRLGAAVRAGLSNPECERLGRDLGHALRSAPGSADLSRELVSALLTALASSAPK
jgi:hypothetical protein